MKGLLRIIAAALMFAGSGCLQMDGGSLLTLSEARQMGVQNLLAVQSDEWHGELAREFRTNRRFHALGREITFAGLEKDVRRAGDDLELALALMQELLLEDTNAAARRMLETRQREILECQLESMAVELLAIEAQRSIWEKLPDHPASPEHLQKLHALWMEKNLLYRTMLGRKTGHALLLLPPEEEIFPVLPTERADLVTALRCRPEFADCGVDAEILAAAAEELHGMLPPASADRSAAAKRTAQQLLLLPRRLTQRKLEGKPVPAHGRILCSALGVMQQLILSRESLENARKKMELPVPDESDPAVRAEKIAAQCLLHQRALELRRDLGLLPEEPLPEDPAERKQTQIAADEIALTAEILMELMQELE